MTGRLIFSEELTSYDFGRDHPMGPGRVRHTISLARQLGVLDRLEIVEPPPVDLDVLRTVHTQEYIDAVIREVPDERFGLGNSDNPVFEGMHEVSARVVDGDRGSRPERLVGRGEAGQQRGRRPAPRDAGPDQRLLRLQRPGDGHPLAAGQRLRADRVRRRRRPSRRRCADDLLGRPPGADGEPARDARLPLPGHRLPARDRRQGRARAVRSTSRCRPAPATRAGCGPSTRSSRPWSRLTSHRS